MCDFEEIWARCCSIVSCISPADPNQHTFKLSSDFRNGKMCTRKRSGLWCGCQTAGVFSWETCRQRVLCVQEHCYEETSCVPGKDAVISFALLVVTVKLSGRTIDLLFDILEVNSQCARPHSKETINMVVTVYLLCQLFCCWE